MLNNKGQSLVLFVVVLPILMLILILVIDIGNIVLLKQELKTISNIVLDYGLENIEKDNIDNELETLVKLNKNDIDSVNIYIKDNKIYVDLKERTDGLFTSFINISIFDVNTSYVGYIDNGEKRIEKMGD